MKKQFELILCGWSNAEAPSTGLHMDGGPSTVLLAITIEGHRTRDNAHLAVSCVVTWMFRFSILEVLARTNAMGSPWQKGMNNSKGDMAKRRPSPKGTSETCRGTHF